MDQNKVYAAVRKSGPLPMMAQVPHRRRTRSIGRAP